MRSGFALSSALVAAALALLPASSRAQRVLGPGDDALVLPRGVIRLRLLGQFTTTNQRYGYDTPGRPNGSLEPIAVDFTLDTVGVREFPNLAPVQAGIRSLSAIPDFTLSLGRTIVNSSINVTATPVVLEVGLTKKISIGIQAPYVHTRNNIAFDVNPLQREGNVGFNPALAVAAARTQNTTLVNQLNGAASALEAAIGGAATCAAPPPTAVQACQLIAGTRQFAGGIAQLYGTDASAGSPFIPIVGTDVQGAIEARIAGLKANFPAAIGNTITVVGPFGSQNRLNLFDAQRILTDSAFGVIADPLQTSEHSHWGDVEIGAKYLWLDTFHGDTEKRFSAKGWNYRSAVAAGFRVGSGQADSPDNFIDVGTGSGANAVFARVYGDLLFGNHFWASSVYRYTNVLSDKQAIRIIDAPNRELAPVWRRRTVDRDLGSYFEFELTPRWVINDYVSVTSQWYYRHKVADSYTGKFVVPGAITGYGDITIDASTNNLETEQTEHRMGTGFSFSTVKAFEDKKVKVPMEVTYLHYQTTRGSLTYKLFTDQIQFRIYARLFGQ